MLGTNKKTSVTNCRGMTMVELMVVVGISSIVMLGAGSIMVFVADTFTKIIDKDEAESSLTRAAYALRLVATQAVNTIVIDAAPIGGGPPVAGSPADEIGGAGSAVAAGLTQGMILDNVNTAISFPDIATDATHRGRMVELAVFRRETSLTATGDSDFRPTGIFFKTPWHACPPNANANVDMDGDGQDDFTRDKCSGQIIITTSDNDNLDGLFAAANNQLFLSPTGYNSEIYSRFSAVSMTATGVAGAGSYARDARIRLTVRYFLSGDPENFTYNPATINGVNIKESSMEVYIGFRNNFLGRSLLVANEAERLHGSLYYFPFVTSLRGF